MRLLSRELVGRAFGEGFGDAFGEGFGEAFGDGFGEDFGEETPGFRGKERLLGDGARRFARSGGTVGANGLRPEGTCEKPGCEDEKVSPEAASINVGTLVRV